MVVVSDGVSMAVEDGVFAIELIIYNAGRTSIFVVVWRSEAVVARESLPLLTVHER